MRPLLLFFVYRKKLTIHLGEIDYDETVSMVVRAQSLEQCQRFVSAHAYPKSLDEYDFRVIGKADGYEKDTAAVVCHDYKSG